MNALAPVIFAPLPMIAGGFACIACDAPLHFGTWSAKGQGRAPSQHYRTHSVVETMTLPVREVVARDAWLLMWWPDPHIEMMPEMMGAFGFSFSAKAFTWIKILKSLARGSRWISTDEIEIRAAHGRRTDDQKEFRELLARASRQAKDSIAQRARGHRGASARPFSQA